MFLFKKNFELRLCDVVEKAKLHSYTHALVPMTVCIYEEEIGIVIDTTKFNLRPQDVSCNNCLLRFLSSFFFSLSGYVFLSVLRVKPTTATAATDIWARLICIG